MGRRSSPGAVEGRVGEGARVLRRLEVREDARAGQALAEPRLDALDEVVTALDGPGSGDEHVQGDEPARAGLPGADGVEADAVALEVGEGGADRVEVGLLERAVH